MTGISTSSEDAKILEFVINQVATFKKHLVSAHGDDPRTAALLAKFKKVTLLPGEKNEDGSTYNSGKFSHSTGTLSVAPRDGSGRPRSIESLNKTIVHELAHATRFKYLGEASHSDEWKKSWVFFLKIATEELGWKVEAPCSAITYYGLKKRECPGCSFPKDPESCGNFTGPPP